MRFGWVIVCLMAAFGALGWWLPEVTHPRWAGAQTEAEADHPVRMVGRAIQALEANDREQAITLLESAMPRLPERSLPRYTAAVLHGQVTGQYAQRLQPWLRRDVADVVVLVEDERSFIEAVGAWTDDLFWPVLMADDWYAPLFVEAFKPAKVVRWRSQATEGETDDDAVRRALAEALQQHNEAITGRADDAPLPPGLVVIDPDGPQRAAGYALAVAHGQPVLALTASGSHEKPTTERAVEQMNDRIMAALESTQLLDRESWTAVTLAGDYPYKYEAPDGEHNPLSVDDRIGRDAQLVRRAFTGRLIGDSVQATYQAMGSLFLQPERPLLINGHWKSREPEPGSPTAWYHLSHAAERLGERYEDVTLIQNNRESTLAFYDEANPKPRFDFWWVNAAHGTEVLQMPGEQLQVDDAPVGRAMPMYVLASFSARNPWNEGELSGRSLRGGAFWYFGSTHEPYLQGFVQSTQLVHRMQPGTPLGAAARLPSEHPFGRPWKLMLVGDPLFTLRPEPAKRVPTPDVVAGEPIAPVRLGEEAELGERLIATLLARDESATLQLLDAAIGDFAELTDDQRAQVVRLLHQAGRTEDLLTLPREEVRGHVIAVTLVRRNLRDRLREELAAQELDAAKRPLAELAELRVSVPQFRLWGQKWLIAMHQADRGREGERFVRQVAEESGSAYRQRSAAEMIEKAAEEAAKE